MSYPIACCFLFALLAGPARPAEDWNYENPNSWGSNYPQCNGDRQSPIQLKSIPNINLQIPPLHFFNYEVQMTDPLTLTNNGHSVELALNPTIDGQRPYIGGPLLRYKYEAMSLHFHWGSNSSKGSEHVVDNQRYDVEMHIVHKNEMYATIAEASQHKDGLTVLGIMFKIDNNPNRAYPGLNAIFDTLPQLTKYQSSTNLTETLTLRHMIGDLDIKTFFSYKGSLTTPSCAEAVTWFVFPRALPISRENIQRFWNIQDTHGAVLLNNFRPLQAVNNRRVLYRPGVTLLG